MKPKLYVVGEDGNRRGEIQRLETLANQLGVADSVMFPGRVDHDHLPLYYNAADVCVLPSYYESFGLVPLEALACGTPVVATNVGDLRNIVREGRTGYVLEDNQPERLAEKIGLILSGNGPEMGDKLSISRSIHYLSWQKIASTFVRALNPLLTQHLIKTA